MVRLSVLCISILAFCSYSAFAGYRINSDSDLTIDTPLYITESGLIGDPKLLKLIEVDPTLPEDSLIILCKGTVKLDFVAIDSTGDVVINAGNVLDIFGNIRSGKNIQLDTVSGDMELDGKFKSNKNIKIKSGSNLTIGKRLAARNESGISTQITKIDLIGVASGQYVKFVPAGPSLK